MTNHPIATENHTAQRLFFLDWLRVLAFAALVIYHVGMYYVLWDFHVKSPFATAALHPWMKLTEPWRMSLIFMISGATTAHMLYRGVSWALLRRRSRFLLLPLLCGVVFVVPPQPFYEVIQKFAYRGSFLDFLSLYFGRYYGFCFSGQCLALPTWNHLWFLPYLWFYTALLCLFIAMLPSFLIRWAAILQRALTGLLLFGVPIVFLFLVRLALFQRFPSSHALIGDWFNHIVYFTMFLTGAAFAAASQMWARLEQTRWMAFIIAITFWAWLVWVRPGGIVEHAVVATFQWGAISACFGFARHHLNFDHSLRPLLTEAVFPVYILHQTMLIATSQVLLPLHLHPGAEAPLLISLTLLLSFCGYLLLRRIAVLRPWFGMRAALPVTPIVPTTAA